MDQAYRNFTIETVADGVYGAIGNGGSNAGIIDLGDQTLIFDTFTTLGAARELKAAAVQLTGRIPTVVVNSHAHADHYQGNLVFAEEASLIASRKTRDAIAAEGLIRLERMKRQMMAERDSVHSQLAGAQDAEQRQRLEALFDEYDEFFAEYPTPQDLRAPTLTYEQSLTFYGSRRQAHLFTYGGAHSPCDAVLWLPDDGVLYAGDLVIPKDNLILSQGNPDQWLPILERLETLHPTWIVPGHKGMTAAGDGFAWARYYLEYINKLVKELVQSETEPDWGGLSAPAGCRRNGFVQNLHFLVDRYRTSNL